MVDSINIPKNLGKVVKVTVEDTSGDLVRFLTNLLIRIDNLEKANKALEARVRILEGP